MSSTNKTTNYDLSQFIGTDKPKWLSDYNGDMSKIDAAINSLASYIDISNVTDYTSSCTYTNATLQGNRISVKVAKNSSGTLGKVYGYARLKATSAGNMSINIGVDTGLRPTSDITINSTVIGGPQNSTIGTVVFTGNGSITIKTDGTLKIDYYAEVTDRWYELTIIPCLLFIQNFGDIGNNQ